MEFNTQKALLRLRGQLPVFQEDVIRSSPIEATYQQQVPCYEFQIPILQQIEQEVEIEMKPPQQSNLQLSMNKVSKPPVDTRKPFIPTTKITKSTYK